VAPLLNRPLAGSGAASLKRKEDSLLGVPEGGGKGAQQILGLSQKAFGSPAAKGLDVMRIGGKKRAVLPDITHKEQEEPAPASICGSQHAPASICGSQHAAGASASSLEGEVKSVEEIQLLLPAEFVELRNMMDLHRELKGQMGKNKEQLAGLGEEDKEMSDLLRSQASHVVGMMKDVLDQMESYPEELWALYGAVEAYEKCHGDMGRLVAGELGREEGDSASLTDHGPTTEVEFREALVDIYSHILETVQGFLRLPPPTK